MSIGELNKGVVALLLVLVVGASGYLWYSQMYQPAKVSLVAAQQSATAAQQSLEAANQQLTEAQQRIEDNKGDGSTDTSIATIAKARAAIPDKQLIDDAAIVLMNVAKRSGIRTEFAGGSEASGESAVPATDSSGGPTPVDLKFAAAGSYDEMINFIRLVEGGTVAKGGKLYTHGRLFNVVSLQMGNAGAGDTEGAAEGGPAVAKGDLAFTVIVRMYVNSTANAQSVGEQTADPAAASTTTAADGGATTNTTGVDGGATSGTDGAATGTDANTAATDQSAAGTNAATGTGAQGTAGTSTTTPGGP